MTAAGGTVETARTVLLEAEASMKVRVGELLRDTRHLLSAAFGLPEDGSINLDLGRFYEQQGRYRRAFSRYVQAVIRPESGAGGLEGLQRAARNV